MSRAFGEKPIRSRKPAQFIVKWARQHLPKRLHDATIREMAAHYLVTDSSVRTWARLEVPPMHGGYPKGALCRERTARQKARRERRRPPKPVVVEPIPQVSADELRGRMRAAFMAELRMRANPHQRLNRIFLAEMKP